MKPSIVKFIRFAVIVGVGMALGIPYKSPYLNKFLALTTCHSVHQMAPADAKIEVTIKPPFDVPKETVAYLQVSDGKNWTQVDCVPCSWKEGDVPCVLRTKTIPEAFSIMYENTH